MARSIVLFVLLCLLLFPQDAARAWELKLGDRVMKGFMYIQPRYTFSPSSNDEFKLYRARIDLWGDVGDKMGYFLEMDITQSPSVIYAWADIKINPEVTLRAGRFFYPFGLEYTTPPSKFDTINPANVSWYYFGYSRDTGIQYKEKREGMKFDLALVNGADNKNRDDNDSKDIVGRVVFEAEKGQEIGFSYYSGKAGSGTLEADKIRSGIDIRYENDGFSLKSEYIAGSGYFDDVGVYHPVRGRGYYVQPAFMMADNLQLIIRHEEWDPDVNSLGDKKTVSLLGLNWFFDPAAKLQVNHEMRRSEEDSGQENVLLLQLQLNF